MPQNSRPELTASSAVAPLRALPLPALITIGICGVVYFLDGLIHSILGPLAPQFSRSLALTHAQLGPIFSANLVGQCIGLILFPLFADRVSERRVVLLSLLGFALTQVGTVFSEGAASFFIWRLIAGVFLGGCLPICLALVTATASVERRGFWIMMIFTAYGVGATLAGVLASLFTDLGGWRAAMLAVAAVCIGAAVLSGWGFGKAGTVPVHAASRAATGVESTWRIFSPELLLGTVMLWLLFICMLTISYCLNSWLPTLMVEVGRDKHLAEMSVSIFSFGGILAGLAVGVVIDRLGALRTLITCLSLSTLLLWFIGQVLASASAASLLGLLAVCGFFVLGAYGGINVVLADYYPASIRAAGIGWTKSVGRVGTLISPVLIGLGLDHGISQTQLLSLFALPALTAVLALAVIAWSRSRHAAA